MPGSPTTYVYDGQPQADAGRRRDRAWRRSPTARSSRARARSTRPSTARSSTRCSASTCSRGRGPRLRDGRRERDQLPLPEPLLRDRPGAERQRAGPDPAPQPGHPVGQHARRRLVRQGLLRRHLGRPERARTRRRSTCNTALGARHVPGAAACRCSTARARRASGTTTRTRSSPGIFGPSHLPRLFRDDYVENSNDSYWLSNPEAAARPASRGSSATRAPSARCARASGLVMIEQRLAGTDGRPGNRFTLQQLQDTVFMNRQYAGELWRDELASTSARRTRRMTGLERPGGRQRRLPGAARPGTCTTTSTRTARSCSGGSRAARSARCPWPARRASTRRSSTPNDPVHTPRGLNIANPRRRAVVRRRGHRPARARASRSTLRCAATSTSAAAPSRSRSTAGRARSGVFNAINVGWSSRARATRTSRTARATCTRRSSPDGVPARRARSSPTRCRPTRTRRSSPTRPACSRTSSGWTRRYCENEIAADPNLQVHDDLGRLSAAEGRDSAARVALARVQAVHVAEPARTGRPLAFPSCAPPAQQSGSLTVGTPDSNGKPANSVGSVRLDVFSCPACAGPINADVRIAASMTDVRNSSDLSDFTGTLDGPVHAAAHGPLQRRIAG